jgi:hypothetical protein
VAAESDTGNSKVEKYRLPKYGLVDLDAVNTLRVAPRT